MYLGILDEGKVELSGMLSPVTRLDTSPVSQLLLRTDVQSFRPCSLGTTHYPSTGQPHILLKSVLIRTVSRGMGAGGNGRKQPIQAPFGNYRSNKSQRQMQPATHFINSPCAIYVCQIIISLSWPLIFGPSENPFSTRAGAVENLHFTIYENFYVIIGFCGPIVLLPFSQREM